jgi:hypothetical protein
MKVLDLCCTVDHRFEGWFASIEAFESQLTNKLISCPVCGTVDVARIPSAPRLNLSGAVAPREPSPEVSRQRMDGAGKSPGPVNSASHDGANHSRGPVDTAAGNSLRNRDSRDNRNTRNTRDNSDDNASVDLPASGSTRPRTLGAEQMREMQGRWMKAIREVMANTEDVGDRFAEEARRMHYSETSSRAIRGTASIEETQALEEEGIEVLALPVPSALKERLQ